MGLFSKIRSRDETQAAPHRDGVRDRDSDESGGEEAPPPYMHDKEAFQASDAKASIASTQEEEDFEAAIPGAVWLDARKADKGGTSIVMRDAGRVAYTFCMDRRWTAGNVLIFRGHASQVAEERNAPSTSTSSPPLPFATIQQRNILLRESPNPQVEPTKYKNKQFLRALKWYAAPNTFTYQSTDYTIRQIKSSWTGKFTLIVANDPEKKPLCMFRPAKKIFGELRESIEILPIAISTGSTSTPHALLHDGEATKLLDLAIIAELMLRRYIKQRNAASSAAAGASGSSAAAACA